MEKRIIDQLTRIAAVDRVELLHEIARVLLSSHAEALTVRAARDTFTKVLNRAKNGDMQVVGKKAEDMAVVMSMQDLAELVVAARPMSFGAALDELGFTPLERRIKVRKGVDHKPLRRKAEKGQAHKMGI